MVEDEAKKAEKEALLTTEESALTESSHVHVVEDSPSKVVAYEDVAPEMEEIYYQEKHHFTTKRMVFILFNFSVMFAANYFYKRAASTQEKGIIIGSFVAVSIALTYWAVNDFDRILKLKEENNYQFDSKDFKFEGIQDIAKLACFCCIASTLCGATGIAGGMVLGPLFLTYNMVPVVMSATNQYITMISALVVAIQFAMLGEIEWYYSGVFCAGTVLAAYLGINGVREYIARGGGQSVILGILAGCLICAFLSLPLKFLTDSGNAAVQSKAAAAKAGGKASNAKAANSKGGNAAKGSHSALIQENELFE